jgi:hypothetical protein
MRVNTDLNTEETFYTDSNGFEMVKRKHFQKLPIQGNYYPMPTAMFIEDEEDKDRLFPQNFSRRLTLLAAQPQGAASLSDGSLEVMQDRILMGDDYRGLGQGVMDNKLCILEYVLLFEATRHAQTATPFLPQLSLKAHLHSRQLNSPVASLVNPSRTNHIPADLLPASVQYFKVPFPHDFHLLALRPLPNLKARDMSDSEYSSPSANSSSLLIIGRLDKLIGEFHDQGDNVER